MNCPNCQRAISAQVFNCPFCGQDLSLFKNVTVLREEIQNAQKTVIEQFARLNQKLDQVERSMGQTPPPAAPMQAPTPVITAEPKIVPPPYKPEAVPPKPAKPPKNYESHLGQKWFLVIGVVLMVFGIGYFLKYSFDQNWIGPAGRVAMAYLAGMAFLGVGNFFRKKGMGAFGLYLIGGGVATLYFSNYAVFQIYHLLSQTVSFGLMILVTVLACALSLAYDNKWLVVLGMIGGFITPILLSTGQADQAVLMTYMTILNVGILSVSAFKQWRLLNYLGFVFTWGLFFGWYADHYQSEAFVRTLVFLNIFFLIYELAPFAFVYRARNKAHTLPFAASFPNGFIALAFAHDMIGGVTQLPYTGLLSIAYAILFLSLASLLHRKIPESRNPFVILLSKGLLFLAVTVPILFNGSQVITVWAVQAAVGLWVSFKLDNRWVYWGSLILLGVTLYNYTSYLMDFNRLDFEHELFSRWVTSLAALASLYFCCTLLKGRAQPRQIHQVTFGIFIALLFYFLTKEVRLFFLDHVPSAAQASVSVLWALFAITLIIVGFIKRNKPLRGIAAGLFGVTVLKVFFNDMQNVTTPFRIISFLVLGLMLIGASYLYYRNKDQQEAA